MEDNKYYTPEISEFHVGFEFEVRWEISENGSTHFEWRGNICSINYPEPTLAMIGKVIKDRNIDGETLPMIYDDIKNCGIRVKYLNKSDIESLGFEPSLDEPEEWFWKYKGNEDIQLYFDDKVREEGQGIGITIHNDDCLRGIAFNGYIKNKSELKKILSMVL